MALNISEEQILMQMKSNVEKKIEELVRKDSLKDVKNKK